MNLQEVFASYRLLRHQRAVTEVVIFAIIIYFVVWCQVWVLNTWGYMQKDAALSHRLYNRKQNNGKGRTKKVMIL